MRFLDPRAGAPPSRPSGRESLTHRNVPAATAFRLPRPVLGADLDTSVSVRVPAEAVLSGAGLLPASATPASECSTRPRPQSAKADFGPLLPRFQPPCHPLGRTDDRRQHRHPPQPMRKRPLMVKSSSTVAGARYSPARTPAVLRSAGYTASAVDSSGRSMRTPAAARRRARTITLTSTSIAPRRLSPSGYSRNQSTPQSAANTICT